MTKSACAIALAREAKSRSLQRMDKEHARRSIREAIFGARGCAAVLALFLIAVPCGSRASKTSASDTVHELFSALAHHDYPAALSLTSGSAAISLGSLLRSVDRAASHAHAEVELVVWDLQLREQGADDAGQTRVDANYDIAIFGKRSFFRRLVRRLVGTTQFIVVDQHIRSFGSLLGR